MNRITLALTALILMAGPAYCADGAKIFQLQCKTCHQAKSSLAGPGLAGVAGRQIASLGDFTYSAGLKGKKGSWTDANLDAFLSGPARFAPGTRMLMGVAAPADRAAVVDYLKTLK